MSAFAASSAALAAPQRASFAGKNVSAKNVK